MAFGENVYYPRWARLTSSTVHSGTRVNARLEDFGSSITFVAKNQLTETAAIDINDIFS